MLEKKIIKEKKKSKIKVLSQYFLGGLNVKLMYF